MWLQFEPLDRVAVDIPFLLMTDILSSSPWPLVLASSSLQLLTMTSNTPQLQSQLQEGTRLVLKVISQRLFSIHGCNEKIKCKFHGFITVCVCVCVQWFCRQASVPASVSVSDVHHWPAAITQWLQGSTWYHGGGMCTHKHTLWEAVAEAVWVC